jgi:hypothetical protein
MAHKERSTGGSGATAKQPGQSFYHSYLRLGVVATLLVLDGRAAGCLLEHRRLPVPSTVLYDSSGPTRGTAAGSQAHTEPVLGRSPIGGAELSKRCSLYLSKLQVEVDKILAHVRADLDSILPEDWAVATGDALPDPKNRDQYVLAAKWGQMDALEVTNLSCT